MRKGLRSRSACAYHTRARGWAWSAPRAPLRTGSGKAGAVRVFPDPGKPKVLCRDEKNSAYEYRGDWWEVQANKAMSLLMPTCLVDAAISAYLTPQGQLGGFRLERLAKNSFTDCDHKRVIAHENSGVFKPFGWRTVENDVGRLLPAESCGDIRQRSEPTSSPRTSLQFCRPLPQPAPVACT